MYHKLQKFPNKSCFHFLKHHRLKAWKRWWKQWGKQSRQTNLHFYLKTYIRRLKKNMSSGLCRPDLGVFFLWPTWGNAGVIASFSSSSGLWLVKAQFINTHSSFSSQCIAWDRHAFSLVDLPKDRSHSHCWGGHEKQYLMITSVLC